MVGDRGRVAAPGVTHEPAPPTRDGLLRRHPGSTQQPRIDPARQAQQLTRSNGPASVVVEHLQRRVKVTVNFDRAGDVSPGQAKLTRGRHDVANRRR